ncbi:MAG TPA: Fe-S cluster assembly ATPase SufC, partial [Planctomycetota bacterium]|nr:Fe-S cluster assembly ATPase SufC [Planctomycetota bacterium]
RDLHTELAGKPILRGVSLTIRPGERHAIMGPNGSGKTTLAMTLMGHPRYEVTKGDILLDGESLLETEADERARKGLFLAFQYPMEIPGVTNASFLRQAVNSVRAEPLSVFDLQKEVTKNMQALEMDASFAKRYLNEGFSGGEKKRNEILQLAMLKPRYAILDETDSGLDIDAVRIVSKGVMELGRKDMGILMITHYTRLLKYIPPQFVHVLVDGKIAKSGGPELADELEATGYAQFGGKEKAEAAN